VAPVVAIGGLLVLSAVLLIMAAGRARRLGSTTGPT